MKLVIMTIVLDGMPFIKWQYECFKKLTCDWYWIVVEGASGNGGSTKWCQPQENRLSNDETHEYLMSILNQRIKYFWNTLERQWESKDHMTRICTDNITEPCVLMQIDADEIHTPQNIDKIVQLFTSDPQLGAIRMPCRFFVGPNLICQGDNCWSNRTFEWLRAWRFKPGMRFVTHEPPDLQPLRGRIMDKPESASHGLTFDHFAYVNEKQVRYKSEFYGYDGLVNQWRALQNHNRFPEQLQRFFPFVDERVTVTSTSI